MRRNSVPRSIIDGSLKTALVDQAAIAGLSNTRSDEALWWVRFHPLTRLDWLSAHQLAHTCTRRGPQCQATSTPPP
jgi:formamidopyrimidine-DNA glycosylase